MVQQLNRISQKNINIFCKTIWEEAHVCTPCLAKVVHRITQEVFENTMHVLFSSLLNRYRGHMITKLMLLWIVVVGSELHW